MAQHRAIADAAGEPVRAAAALPDHLRRVGDVTLLTWILPRGDDEPEVGSP